jgi:hypothetical protein
MFAFNGSNELRGTLVNENTLELSNGKIHSLDFSANQSKIGKDVVIRLDESGKPIVTEMLCS